MITSRKLHNFISTGKTTSQPHTRHRRLCPTIAKANLLDGRNQPTDYGSQLYFSFVGCSETDPLFGGIPNGINDLRMGMPKNGRPPTPYIVDVFLSIRIPQSGTESFRHEKGLTSHRTESPDGGMNTPWGYLFGTKKKIMRPATHAERLHFLAQVSNMLIGGKIRPRLFLCFHKTGPLLPLSLHLPHCLPLSLL
jgi:hypothetical protein